jgi:hypothetical protein
VMSLWGALLFLLMVATLFFLLIFGFVILLMQYLQLVGQPGSILLRSYFHSGADVDQLIVKLHPAINLECHAKWYQWYCIGSELFLVNTYKLCMRKMSS